VAEFLDLISSLGFGERDEASPVNRRELTTLCHGCFRVFAHTPKLIDIVLKQPPRQARLRRGPDWSIERRATLQDFRSCALDRVVFGLVSGGAFQNENSPQFKRNCSARRRHKEVSREHSFFVGMSHADSPCIACRLSIGQL